MNTEIGNTRDSVGLDTEEQTKSHRGPFPILTAAACAICVVVFAGLNQPVVGNSQEFYARWGVFRGAEIRSGAVWGLITSTFAHFELWHIAFNLYWLWQFGSVLERTIGRVRWAALYLALAFISSSAELTVAGE